MHDIHWHSGSAVTTIIYTKSTARELHIVTSIVHGHGQPSYSGHFQNKHDHVLNMTIVKTQLIRYGHACMVRHGQNIMCMSIYKILYHGCVTWTNLIAQWEVHLYHITSSLIYLIG